MEKLLLLLCAASALSQVSSLPARQYYFIYEQKNWTEARSYCREKFTDLATVDSLEDVDTLRTMADLDRMVYSSYSHRAWIGLYDDMNSWRWSLSDADFYQDGDAEFRNWGTDPPNNYGRKERCTRLGGAGRWSAAPCFNNHRSVCVDIRGQNVTFVRINRITTWPEARRYCREHHTDLASVRNQAENQEVENLAQGSFLWIGLFRDSWKWADGRNLSFTLWGDGQPYGTGDNCVVSSFQESGKWEDWSCDLKMAFVCESAPVFQQVVKVTLENRSDLDLNDPAVQEALLQQLQQKQRKQEMRANISVSWRKKTDGKIFHQDEDGDKF